MEPWARDDTHEPCARWRAGALARSSFFAASSAFFFAAFSAAAAAAVASCSAASLAKYA